MSSYTVQPQAVKAKKPIVLREPYTVLRTSYGKRCAVFQNFKNKMWYMVSNNPEWSGGMFGNELSPEERAQCPLNFSTIGCFSSREGSRILQWLENEGFSNYDIEEANQ